MVPSGAGIPMALLTLRAPDHLDCPPGFTAIALPEAGDAYGHARAIASQEGAGTLVWVDRPDVAEFAVVLEPDAPLSDSRKSLFMGMNALLQAVAAHCPPERAVTFDWPDALRFNAGLIGGGRLGWPQGCAEDEVPDWLIFGASVRVALPGLMEPGEAPDSAALEDEGFAGSGPTAIIESFARFLMLQVDLWHSAGYGPILADFARRLTMREDEATRSLTEDGDLRLSDVAGIGERVIALRPALTAPSWIDRNTGALRL